MIPPTIVFGDIHGLTTWKQVVAKNPNCRYVFLGDYLDPFESIEPAALLQNLQEIIELKKSQPENVILLLGNHDMHYITSDMVPSLRFDLEIYEAALILFTENFDLFQYAFQDGKYIFTHAGISQAWFINDFQGDTNKNIAEQLNNPTNEQVSALCRVSELFGGRRGALGGIFFAHWQELYDPLQGYIQVVGHHGMIDSVATDEISEYKTDNATVIFCDAFWNNQYLRIDDTPQQNSLYV